LPKSSLDGCRETVFDGKVDFDNVPSEFRGQLRLSSGEELDAVGLTKRMGGDRHGCPSVSTIAASPWVRGASSKCPSELQALRESCESLVPSGLGRASWPQFVSFPYEGSVVYRHRHQSLKDELRIEAGGRTEKEAFAFLQLAIDEIEKVMREPAPYFVILAADGDRMGETISELAAPKDHQNFSQALSSWGTKASQVIVDHFGWPVYVGGDDVLAFVPLDTAVHSAQVLHDSFSITVGGQVQGKLRRPTLSVGLAIVGYQEPMELSLKNARQAEKGAKGTDRDGLAVHYHPGSGAPILVRGRWADGIATRLEQLTVMHRDNLIGDKAAYDLRELSRLYEKWPVSPEVSEVIRADAKRLFSRKPGAEALPSTIGFSDIMASLSSSQDVIELANEVIVARLFGRARSVSGWILPELAGG